MTGRSKVGRGGAGRGRGRGRSSGNYQGHDNSGAISLLNQRRVVTDGSLQSGQSSPYEGPTPESGQSSIPRQRPIESESSRIQSVNPSLDAENGVEVSGSNRKKGRGKYKSKTVDIKTKCGSKIKVNIPDDIDRAVGPGARDIVNYCGLIMRNTVSFQDGNWKNIISKHGEVMWLKIKDKFEVCSIVKEPAMQSFVVSTMQRLFRAWKARLSAHYCLCKTDEERLSRRPGDVEPDDWKYLIEYFGSEAFKAKSERNKRNREKQITKHLCGTRSFAEVEESTRNVVTGEKDPPCRVWEIQHTRKNERGEVECSDPHAEQVHRQLLELVNQQQSEEVEHHMSRDEILSSVLGDRPGYVRGKGYGKKPPKKSRTQPTNLEASMSSAMDIMRQEMQAEMDRKLQEEREKMAADLQKNMEEEREKMAADLQKNMEEERHMMNIELDKRVQLQVNMQLQEQFATFMAKMQQVQGLSNAH